MQSSSPSGTHCTQVPIKVQHRRAKKKFRRRRVDLECGCSYAISCHNHGFTHRGVHHCSSSREWRLYLDGSKSPLFQDDRSPQQAFPVEPRHNNGKNTVQLQPAESTGDSPMFPNLPNLDELTPSDWSFLKSI
nr:TrAP [Fenugreek yellow vein virus]